MPLEVIKGLNVSRETFEALKYFEALVLKWTKRINLISKNTENDIWERHICDSAQLYLLAPQVFKKWVDLGSGGGFPGIVLSILAKELNPTGEFILIESDQRKSTFLRTAIRELGLNAKVITDRIENVDPQSADIVSARALMPLEILLEVVQRHNKKDGIALLPKGINAEQEIKDARQKWDFELNKQRSLIDNQSSILLIQRIVNLDEE